MAPRGWVPRSCSLSLGPHPQPQQEQQRWVPSWGGERKEGTWEGHTEWNGGGCRGSGNGGGSRGSAGRGPCKGQARGTQWGGAGLRRGKAEPHLGLSGLPGEGELRVLRRLQATAECRSVGTGSLALACGKRMHQPQTGCLPERQGEVGSGSRAPLPPQGVKLTSFQVLWEMT